MMAPLVDRVDRDRLVAAFLELVGIDSPTGHEDAMSWELAARLSALGCDVHRDRVGNLVATLPGTRPGAILLATHMDTAGTDTGIQPIIADGVIRTDGSTILGADDKAGIAACLELLAILYDRDLPSVAHPTVEFVITVGGKRGLVGSRRLDTSRLTATHGFVLDAAGAVGSITYWAPTSVSVAITVHGRRAHAGVEPENDVNAIRVAAEAVAAMPLGRIDEETVAVIGTVAGGAAGNAVPGEVRLEGTARSHDQAKLDVQLRRMRHACADVAKRHGTRVEFTAEEIYRTYRIPETALPYREAARAIRSLGLPVVPRKSGVGTDGNVLNAKGIPCVGLATGMVDQHAPTEHIAIDDLVLACQVVVSLVTQEPQQQHSAPPLAARAREGSP